MKKRALLIQRPERSWSVTLCGLPLLTAANESAAAKAARGRACDCYDLMANPSAWYFAGTARDEVLLSQYGYA